MISTQNIFSLTDFQRNTKAHMQRLKESGKPEVLTINGQAELIVQNAAAYQALIDRLEAIEGIRLGLSSMEQNEGRPIDDFFKEFAEKHQLEK
jgi:PHD/YefM family antitoxin component YafN of YafNO toxin-antitoxin module